MPKASKPAPRLSVRDFQTAANVSRETLARLEAYGALLKKWNPHINLVSRRSLDDLWRRHMLDSIQLLDHSLPNDVGGPWLDLGSGAGFPGLVLAIAGVTDMHLVESDGRKCTFLREAARITGTEVTVHNERIETMSPMGAAVISARACAPLSKLLTWGHRHLAPGGQMFLMKGQDVDVELTEAAKCWKMTLRLIPSVTDETGSILQLTEITRV